MKGEAHYNSGTVGQIPDFLLTSSAAKILGILWLVLLLAFAVGLLYYLASLNKRSSRRRTDDKRFVEDGASRKPRTGPKPLPKSLLMIKLSHYGPGGLNHVTKTMYAKWEDEVATAIKEYSKDDVIISSSGRATRLYEDFNDCTAQLSLDGALTAISDEQSFREAYPYYALANALVFTSTIVTAFKILPDHLPWGLGKKKYFYRGGNFPNFNFIEGNYICFDHMLSVSASKDVAMEFTVNKEAPTLFTIDAYYCDPYSGWDPQPVSIEKYSEFPYEREYLFHPDANFYIAKVKWEQSIQHVKLRYINVYSWHQFEVEIRDEERENLHALFNRLAEGLPFPEIPPYEGNSDDHMD